MEKIIAYQIYYDQSQRTSLLPGFDHFFNQKNEIFCENSVLIELFRGAKQRGVDFDWMGVFSWKVKSKIPRNPNFSLQYLQKCANKYSSTHDIIAPKLSSYDWSELNQGPAHPRILHCHPVFPGYWRCMDLILKKLKIPNLNNGNHLDRPITQIFTNIFLAKQHVLRSYIDEFLEPTIELIKHDEEVRHLAYLPSDYFMPFPKSLQLSTGLNYWPFVPFILERMINVFIFTKKLGVNYIL